MNSHSSSKRSARRCASACTPSRSVASWPAGDEVDPELAGGLQARLLRLAREEEVVALVGGPDQLAAARRPSRSRLAAIRSGPVREDERLAPADDLRMRATSSSTAHGSCRQPPMPTSPKAQRSTSTPSALGEERVVAELRMGVEREVVRREAQVRARRAPRAGRAGAGRSRRGSLRQNMPWWTSTSCAPAAAARSKSSREDETPHAIFVTSSAPSTCRPGRAVLGEAVDLEQLVRVADDLVAVGQGAIIATLRPLGVWRSLVARSVRVGEVPSSNLGTPISCAR